MEFRIAVTKSYKKNIDYAGIVNFSGGGYSI